MTQSKQQVTRSKHRSRWERHPGQEIHSDRRTRRIRSRNDALKAALEDEIREIDEALEDE